MSSLSLEVFKEGYFQGYCNKNSCSRKDPGLKRHRWSLKLWNSRQSCVCLEKTNPPASLLCGPYYVMFIATAHKLTAFIRLGKPEQGTSFWVLSASLYCLYSNLPSASWLPELPYLPAEWDPPWEISDDENSRGCTSLPIQSPYLAFLSEHNSCIWGI